MIARFRHILRRFTGSSRGAVAVEFALILPVMLTLYLGTLEVSDLIAVDRRVSIISGTVADLVARSDDGVIASTTLRDYFKAAEGIIMPYSKTPLKQVVTMLTVAANGTATVTWSCGFNGGTALNANTTYTWPASANPTKAIASDVGFVVMSDMQYAYRPLLGTVINTAVTLHRVNYYYPRFGALITRSGACPTT